MSGVKEGDQVFSAQEEQDLVDYVFTLLEGTANRTKLNDPYVNDDAARSFIIGVVDKLNQVLSSYPESLNIDRRAERAQMFIEAIGSIEKYLKSLLSINIVSEVKMYNFRHLTDNQINGPEVKSVLEKVRAWITSKTTSFDDEKSLEHELFATISLKLNDYYESFPGSYREIIELLPELNEDVLRKSMMNVIEALLYDGVEEK